MRVGVGGVDEARHLGVAVGEVDLEVAALLGDAGADVDVLGSVAIVVEERLALVDAVLPAGNDGAHLPLGTVEHGRDRRMRRRRAELGEQLAEPALADARRADHGREIAAEVAGMAHIEHDHLVDVLAPLALLVELQRRNADAFLEDLGRAGVVGSVRGAADVALVRAVDRPEHQPVAVEDGHERRQVRQMIAAPVGVVQQVDVARPDPPLEELVHGPWPRTGSAPTWIGTCSAWAINRPSGSQSAVEKSRLEFRICE